MPVDVAALSAIARDYASSMTSIRGRRVQRLLMREFAGAECVVIAPTGPDEAAVLGLSASGAAFCSTDGRGRHVSVVKWLHGSTGAVETSFDLLKDSLPVLSSVSLPLPVQVRETMLGFDPETLARPQLDAYNARGLERFVREYARWRPSTPGRNRASPRSGS